MPSTPLPAGIYRQPHGGYRVVVWIGDTGRREKRFPKESAIRTMTAWQKATYTELRREDIRPALGTLAADIERYLGRPEIQRLVSWKTRRSDTNHWLAAFGHLRRDQNTSEAIQRQCDDWYRSGVAAWTVRHRLQALSRLYVLLDGPTAFNPTRGVKAPKPPDTAPRWLDYTTIRAVFAQMEPSATKAFLLVMAFCGFRPVEIRRVDPRTIRLDGPNPSVERPSAKGGKVVTVPLSPEGVAAWKMFIEHDGTELQPNGKPRTFLNANRDWKAAMRRAGDATVQAYAKRLRVDITHPKVQERIPTLAKPFTPTRCYDLVHSWSTQVLRGSGDITVVQELRGHRDVRTTRIYTTTIADPRHTAAIAKAFTSTAPDKAAVGSVTVAANRGRHHK